MPNISQESRARLAKLRTATMHSLLLLGACVLVAGCITGVRMQPPDSLGGDVGELDLLEVTDRKQFGRGLLTSESFGLGSYRISDVDRAWNKNRSSSRELWFFEGQRVRTSSVGGFSFSLDLGGQALSGSCDTAVLSKAHKFGSWSMSDNAKSMGCRCWSGDRLVSSLWVTDVKAGSAWSGWLAVGETKHTFESDKRLEGNKTSAGPAGYRFDGATASPVRAIDITHPGRAWLRPNLSPQDRAAAGCAVAALLLEPTPPRTETE